MKLVIATREGSPFDGVLWQSYFANGGPTPSAAIFVTKRAKSADSSAARAALEALLLFRFTRLARLAAARRFGRPLGAPDRAAGLHRNLNDFIPAACIHRCHALNSQEGADLLRRLQPDLLLSVGVEEILPAEILNIPRLGCLNLHNGLLPAYKGLFGTFWEMLNGEPDGYVTVHKMIEQLDSGGIVGERPVRLGRDLFRVLVDKKKDGGALLADVLQGIERDGHVQARPLNGRRDGRYFGWPTIKEMATFAFRAR